MDNLAQKRPLEIEIDLTVRTYDIDFSGIVSNIVYIRWLEDLRLEMLAHYFPLDEQLQKGIAPIIMQTRIDYKQPIKIADEPIGKMWVKTLTSLRWTVNAAIVLDDKIAAFGEQVGVFVDLQTNKPIRIPDELKQTYQEFIGSLPQSGK